MKSRNIATVVAATSFLSFAVVDADAASPPQPEDQEVAAAELSLRGRRRGKNNQDRVDRDRLLEPIGDMGRLPDFDSDGISNRIVNGDDSDLNEFPYYVDLRSANVGCGGTLISEKVVLTAAHCDGNYINKKVLVGGYRPGWSVDKPEEVTDGAQWIEVDADVPHPGYRSNTLENDFRLLRLAGEGAEVREPKASISSAGELNDPAIGTTLRVIGLGTLSSGGASASVLQDVKVDVKDCDNYNGEVIEEVMFCAAGVNDKGTTDSCQGDSGGPIVIEHDSVHELVGVVSWGYGCADPEYPGVYAKVGARNEWIKNVVCCGDDAFHPEAEFCSGYECLIPDPCTDFPGWVDSYGDGCEWYETNDDDGCPNYGGMWPNPSSGETPNNACCYCGGGIEEEEEEPPAEQESIVIDGGFIRLNQKGQTLSWNFGEIPQAAPETEVEIETWVSGDLDDRGEFYLIRDAGNNNLKNSNGKSIKLKGGNLFCTWKKQIVKLPANEFNELFDSGDMKLKLKARKNNKDNKTVNPLDDNECSLNDQGGKLILRYYA